METPSFSLNIHTCNTRELSAQHVLPHVGPIKQSGSRVGCEDLPTCVKKFLKLISTLEKGKIFIL